MILSQLSPEMLKGVPLWLVSAGAVLWISNECFKLAQNLKGKAAEPPNEQLYESHKALTRRVDHIEEEISDIRREIKEKHEASQQHASARSNTIFSKMEAVRLELKTDIDKLNTEVNKLPERILEVLTKIQHLGKR
jgi:polyhydroxyalkanoate synthesis regulator phasin